MTAVGNRRVWQALWLSLATALLVAASLAPSASAASRPDLVVSSVGTPPASADPGSGFSISDTVKNKGKKKARASVNEYTLSTDTNANRGDLVLGGSRAVKALRPKKKSSGSADVSVPSSAKPGEYHVMVCADAGEKVKEKKERNNCSASEVKLSVTDGSPPPPPDTTPPGTPAITDTDPDSPAADANPEVKGTGAEDGSSVSIYGNASCTGAPLASGAAASFGGAGITVAVPQNTTTELVATATDAAGNVSGCSASFPYTHDSSGESEPNDTPATANTMPESGVVPAAIDPAGDEDWFSFTIPAGPNKAVIAQTFGPVGDDCGGDRDTVLELYAADGATQISSNDDGGFPPCSKIDGTGPHFTQAGNLAPGTYFLRVTDFALDGDQVISAYRLEVSIVDSPGPAEFESEPNNSSATANPMPAGEAPIGAAIDPATDEDWFSFTIPAGPNKAVVAQTFDASGTTCAGTNTTMRLYAPDGTTILVDDPGGLCSRIDGAGPHFLAAGNLAPGTYFLRVAEDGANAVIPSYVLKVNLVDAASTEVESNNAFTKATPMPAGERPILAAIGPNVDDEDWFSFTIPPGANKAVDAATSSLDGNGCSGDTAISIYAPDGTTQLASDDDDGLSSSCSQLAGAGLDNATLGSLAPGTYFVRVIESGQDAPIAGYRLQVNLFDPPSSVAEVEPNDTFATAMALTQPTIVAGSIAAAGDQDWYAITVPEGGSVRAQTFVPGGCPGPLDTLVRLFAADGTTQRESDDDTGIGQCSWLDGTRPSDGGARNLAAGTYYVRVEEFGNNDAIPDYRLSVTVVP